MRRIVLLLVLGILCGVVAGWWLMQPRPDGGTGAASAVTPQLLQRAIDVVAIAENGKDYRAAIDGWTELLAARPADRDLLLNQAVTVLKWINDTNAMLSSGSIQDADEIAQHQKQLIDANAEADRVLQRLTQLPSGQGSQESTQVLLESELLATRSRSVADSEAFSLRRQAAEKLIGSLNSRPDQPLLAARLLQLADELKVDWPEASLQATEAAYKAWRAQPRNLFLLVRAGQGLADAKDKRLLEVVEASRDLAKPLLSMMKESDLKIAQPDALVETTKKVVESGDWSKPPRVRPWFNILTGTSAFNADRRLLTPDIMALLNTSFLERWRQALPTDSNQATALRAIEVTATAVPDAIVLGDAESPPLIAWYDYDVDRDFDLLAVHGTKLRITRRDENQPGVLESELPFAPTGLLIADLWTVDSPQRPMSRTTEPANSSSNNEPPSKDLPSDEPPNNSSLSNKPSNNEPSNKANVGNNHNTIQELLLWNDQRVVVASPDLSGSQMNLLNEVPGLTGISGIQQIAIAELDGDGDLDLVVSTASGLKFMQNNGNRTFQDITQHSSLPPSDWSPSGMVACDFDRDLDLDIVCTSRTSPYLAVMENILHSQFRFRPLNEGHWQGNSELSGLKVLELDGNASWDLAMVADKSVDIVLTRTVGPGQLTPTLRQTSALTGSRGPAERMELGDLNLDGHIDLCTAGPRGVRVYWNDGQRLKESPDAIFDQPANGLDIQDVDGDGRLELLTSVKGVALVLRAEPQGDAHYVAARVRGVSDDNGGGRINHYSIGSTLEVWADGRYQARVVQSPLTHFGLPGQEATDLRIIFNNGLTQNVIHPTADSLVQERQELKGSCPFVYGWDGERFQMITDLLWNAPLGLQLARGTTLPDRRWENLLLPGKFVQPRDGAIELRVTEELWEVAYFDHVQLTAVDHPSEVDVWTNEKVGPPTLAEPRLFTVSQPIYPVAARDGYGRDVLSHLRHRDGQFVQAFRQQICQGLCEPHSIELTFDPKQFARRHDMRLVITGWMHPTDTSLNIGISQNASRQLPEPPSLWAPDAKGEFVCKQPFMGFPGGKPKTIVIDLNGVWEGDDTRLRIASSQQIYWDQISIALNEPPVPLMTEELNLQSAQLQHRGFGRLLPRASDQPHWYDYQEVSQSPKWPPLEGLFTRYGDVLPHMQSDDDRMVVMASGDEMILKFAMPARALPAGWTRDYVLHSVGWDKDADLNTLEGQSSLPLPFATMHAYPPSLEDEQRAQEVWELNEDSLVPRALFEKFRRVRLDALEVR